MSLAGGLASFGSGDLVLPIVSTILGFLTSAEEQAKAEEAAGDDLKRLYEVLGNARGLYDRTVPYVYDMAPQAQQAYGNMAEDMALRRNSIMFGGPPVSAAPDFSRYAIDMPQNPGPFVPGGGFGFGDWPLTNREKALIDRTGLDINKPFSEQTPNAQRTRDSKLGAKEGVNSGSDAKVKASLWANELGWGPGAQVGYEMFGPHNVGIQSPFNPALNIFGWRMADPPGYTNFTQPAQSTNSAQQYASSVASRKRSR